MPFQMEPFNGDTFIQNKFIELRGRFDLKMAIETGTCLGSTTMFLDKNFNHVTTIESNEEYFMIALDRIRKNKCENTSVILGKSEVVLRETVFIFSNTIFFLDAHWGQHCPLPLELKAIADAGIKPVIAIHDFKVPGEPKLGYDSYPDFTIDFESCKPYFDMIYGEGGYEVEYNSDETSTEVKRGIIYVTPKQ
jgi:hypothetical protein